MRRAADSDRGEVELAGLLFRKRNELLQVVGRQLRARQQDLIAERDQRDRREVALPVVGQWLAVQCRRDRDRPVGDEVKGVSVGIGTCRELGADDTAGARLVVDDDLLAPEFSKLLSDQARKQVAAATGRIRHDEADRLAREVLRRRAAKWRDR